MRITIHPLFLVFGILCCFFNLGTIFLSYLISIMLHEWGHAIVAKKFGYKLKKVSFLPFGAELNINQKFYKNHEIWISLAGPFVNVLLIAFCIALWWIFPLSYYYLENFVFTNVIILVFNLLPIYPLDGGRVLLALLSKKILREKSEKIVFIFSFLISLSFFILFLLTLFFVPNWSVGIISIFLMTSSLNFNKSAVYERVFLFRDYLKMFTTGSEVKIVAVDENMPIYKLPNFLDANHFCIFVVFYEKKKLGKVILENNLEKIFLENDATILIKDIK